MNAKRLIVASIVLLALVLVISGCAVSNQAQDSPGSDGVAGFWPGLWHGLILPVSFVISLFDSSVGIYEIHNNGNWYNFGFVFGANIIFGSILAGNKKR
jgi:hypothetical protein